MSNALFVIDQSLIDFLESPVAILVASRDEGNRPVITRGFGARVSDDCSQVTVFVTEKQSAAVLRDIEQSQIVVFTAANITNYESYQLKGNNAYLVDLSIKDERHISQYLETFQLEMTKVGVTPKQAAAMFQSRNNENIVGIKFTTQEIYCQTPGPGAGKPREQDTK